MELALSQVNERTDILPEYRLHMVLNDTKVYTITQGSHLTVPRVGWVRLGRHCRTALWDCFRGQIFPQFPVQHRYGRRKYKSP